MHYRVRHYKLKTRRAARSLEKRYRNHPRLIPILVGLSVIFIGLILAFTLRDNTIVIKKTDSNIVVLHADHETRILPTRATTVQGFLEGAGVMLNEGDIVEPSLETEIQEDDFRVNVYRAAPVVIQDDDKRIVAMSAAQTSRSIADQAGLVVHPEDVVTTAPSEDFLRDGISHKVTIKRSVPISLNLYGAQLSLRTQATTVGGLLAEKGINIAPDDTVQPSAETPLTDGIQILVTRFGVQVVAAEESIAMPVETIEDSSLSYGTLAIRQKGAAGLKTVTYQLELQNGVEVGRTVLQEIITQEPVTQIVARGTSGKFENFDANGIPARVFCGSPRQGNWKNINTANALAGREMAAAKGWSGSEYNALLELFACESSWSHTAGNPYSGAYGIPQSLPASKMGDPAACGAADYLTNPRTQIAWGLCYIQKRHGSPSGALQFHYRNNWY